MELGLVGLGVPADLIQLFLFEFKPGPLDGPLWVCRHAIYTGQMLVHSAHHEVFFLVAAKVIHWV